MSQREFWRHIEARIGQHGCYRQDPPTERLAEHDDVRRRTEMLMGEEAAGLAEPCRDFVEDQLDPMLVAYALYRAPEAGRRNDAA
jgi:hypothetical protein